MEKIQETKKVNITKVMITRKERYLTKGEVKHIKGMIFTEYFDKVLRIEKLSENIYTIRFKKIADKSDYMEIKKILERRGYTLSIRTKSYKEIREEQHKIALEKTTEYLKDNLKSIKKLTKQNRIVDALIEECNKIYKIEA